MKFQEYSDVRESAHPQPLLNCPFCGGDRLTILHSLRFANARPGDIDGWAFQVHCTSCACEGPWKKSATGACTDWNRRPPLPRTEDAPSPTVLVTDEVLG